MDTLYDYGYAIWCQRNQCNRCRDVHCECKHHKSTPDLPQRADPEILAICAENAVQRGSLAYRCQMGQHKYCKKSRCNCKCHVTGMAPSAPAPVVTPKEDLPLASDENVLELQERIYAAEAAFRDKGDQLLANSIDAVNTIGQTAEMIKQEIAGFDERLATMEAKKSIVISSPKAPDPIDVGIQHYLFPKLVRYLSYGKIPFLVGPAGSGKTAACQAAAKALDLSFEYLSINQQTSQPQIMGYNAADGRYIETGFYRIYTKGGLWLGDELDGGLPGIIKVINAPIENGMASFGSSMYDMHEDTHFVFAANTYGKGADGMYVGANQLDGSTLNRFVTMEWEYDWNLASHICQNEEIVGYIRKLHEIASDLKLKVIIGMRDAKNLSDLLRNGENRAEAEYDVVWASIDTDDRAKIKANLPSEYAEACTAGQAGIGGGHWS